MGVPQSPLTSQAGHPWLPHLGTSVRSNTAMKKPPVSVVSGEARRQCSAPGKVLRPRWGQEGKTGASLQGRRAQAPGATWQPSGAPGRPSPEGPRVLLQGISDHIFILFLAKGACGVDQATQGGKGERVAQCPLLEARQGTQALLARCARALFLQWPAQHPWKEESVFIIQLPRLLHLVLRSHFMNEHILPVGPRSLLSQNQDPNKLIRYSSGEGYSMVKLSPSHQSHYKKDPARCTGRDHNAGQWAKLSGSRPQLIHSTRHQPGPAEWPLMPAAWHPSQKQRSS